MSELRKDPITGRWVIIAPDRANRPFEYQSSGEPSRSLFDPFAEGNESATPPEILAFRDPGSKANRPGWRVRVVPNRFPAVEDQECLEQRSDGIYHAIDGVGAHEVIIEGPGNETNMSRLPVETIREVLLAYRERLTDLKKDRRLAHGLIFKNKGAKAGASLAHSHSQLIATSIVPIVVQEELARTLDYYKNHGHGLYKEILRQELADQARVVFDTPGFLVFCPYASRFAFETWIVPKQHGSHYENIGRRQLEELGSVLKTILTRLELVLDDPPYNYILHTAPFHVPDNEHYCWRLEIFPRLTGVAGFEWGSGCFINSAPPEQAAACLREADSKVLDSDPSSAQL